jgi:leucyl/phenylalanyl-tRNA--protein transferase
MFSLKSNASKFGFITLARRLASEGFQVIDCQQPNPYLASLGGEFISGQDFQSILSKNRIQFLKDL